VTGKERKNYFQKGTGPYIFAYLGKRGNAAMGDGGWTQRLIGKKHTGYLSNGDLKLQLRRGTLPTARTKEGCARLRYRMQRKE